MRAYKRAWVIAVPLVIAAACSVEQRNFSSGSGGANATAGGGASSTSHVGGHPSTGSNSGAGGSGTGASTGTAGGGGGALTIDKACEQYATAVCDKWNECGPDTVMFEFGTKEICVARWELWCGIMTAKPTSWTPENLSACGSTLGTLSCGSFLTLPDKIGPDLCAPPLGTLDDGAICHDSSQCHSGYCQSANGCGTCAPKGGVGTVCEHALDCQSGLACSDSTSPSSCQTALQSGQDCSMNTTGCAPGLVCYLSSSCQDPQAHGQYCQQTSDCDTRIQLYCDQDSNECLPNQYSDIGGPCGYDTESDGGVYIESVCKALGVCSDLETGTCAAGPKEGERCGIRPTRSCTFPAVCAGDFQTAACTLPNKLTCM